MWSKRRQADERSSREAERALKDATQSVRRAKARQRDVTNIAEALRMMRERNHFIEQLEVMMMVEKPK